MAMQEASIEQEGNLDARRGRTASQSRKRPGLPVSRAGSW